MTAISEAVVRLVAGSRDSTRHARRVRARAVAMTRAWAREVGARGWAAAAACARLPDLPWQPHTGRRVSPRQLGLLAAVCDNCPVLAQCADYADAAGTVSGFWGGSYDDTPTEVLPDDQQWHPVQGVPDDGKGRDQEGPG